MCFISRWRRLYIEQWIKSPHVQLLLLQYMGMTADDGHQKQRNTWSVSFSHLSSSAPIIDISMVVYLSHMHHASPEDDWIALWIALCFIQSAPKCNWDVKHIFNLCQSWCKWLAGCEATMDNLVKQYVICQIQNQHWKFQPHHYFTGD